MIWLVTFNDIDCDSANAAAAATKSFCAMINVAWELSGGGSEAVGASNECWTRVGVSVVVFDLILVKNGTGRGLALLARCKPGADC